MVPQKHALSLIAKSESAGALLPNLPKVIAAQLEAIRTYEAKAAGIAVQLGATLWHVKAAVKHGEFQAWLKTNVEGRCYRTCAYYMKLALMFAESARLTGAEWAALPEIADVLPSAAAGIARTAWIKRQKFIGDLSLSELLIKHGIKGVGLRSELAGGDEPAPLAAGDNGQLFFTEIADHLMGLRATVLKRETIMRCTPEQLDTLKTEIDRTHSEFSDLYAQARGRKP